MMQDTELSFSVCNIEQFMYQPYTINILTHFAYAFLLEKHMQHQLLMDVSGVLGTKVNWYEWNILPILRFVTLLVTLGCIHKVMTLLIDKSHSLVAHSCVTSNRPVTRWQHTKSHASLLIDSSLVGCINQAILYSCQHVECERCEQNRAPFLSSLHPWVLRRFMLHCR